MAVTAEVRKAYVAGAMVALERAGVSDDVFNTVLQGMQITPEESNAIILRLMKKRPPV